jgi:hypothetical protein
MAVTARPDGGFTVRGLSQPDVRVRLAAQDGAAYGVTADAEGRFAIDLPRAPRPQLLAVGAEVGGRMVMPRGRLFLPPAGEAGALLLSPGAPSKPLSGEMMLGAVDYDRGGGLAVSGKAAPGAEVRVLLDGTLVRQGRPDAQGRFGLVVPGSVSPGAHLIALQSAGRSVERRIELVAATGGAEASAVENGWRVVWTPEGGGTQTSWVFALPSTPSP